MAGVPKCVRELDLLSQPHNGLSAHTVGFLASSWFLSDLCEGRRGVLGKNLASRPGVVSGMHCYSYCICRALLRALRTGTNLSRMSLEGGGASSCTPLWNSEDGKAVGVWEGDRYL